MLSGAAPDRAVAPRRRARRPERLSSASAPGSRCPCRADQQLFLPVEETGVRMSAGRLVVDYPLPLEARGCRFQVSCKSLLGESARQSSQSSSSRRAAVPTPSAWWGRRKSTKVRGPCSHQTRLLESLRPLGSTSRVRRHSPPVGQHDASPGVGRHAGQARSVSSCATRSLRSADMLLHRLRMMMRHRSEATDRCRSVNSAMPVHQSRARHAPFTRLRAIQSGAASRHDALEQSVP